MRAALAGLLGWAAGAGTVRAQAPGGDDAANYTITVDGAGPRVKVSPLLYGVAFEDINHAGEGGLYGELVMNRDFEITDLPKGARWSGNLLRTQDGWLERKWFGNDLWGWQLLTEGGAQGDMKLVEDNPLNDNHPHSLRLTERVPGGRLEIVNGGFWGMNIQKGKWYDLSFFARTENGEKFAVTARLESASGRESYGEAMINDVGGGWWRYTCSIQATDSDPAGRLALSIAQPGTLWLDLVSLFPRDTFHGRANGLRPDLAGLIADLHPAFLRFPGGATVGGLNLDDRIQWKNSIGPLERRKGDVDLWGYWNTNGLGFHEFLQFCEDLGARAVWVCNAGASDSFRHAEIARPDEIPAFIQEALDALEYARGPVTSKWGALRAANGHPAPFDELQFVEIGDEGGGLAYRETYKKFRQAIHARYPDITIISDVPDIHTAPVGMVDVHKFGVPATFFSAFHLFDKATRPGPKIEVGEYGCNSGVGAGTLEGALAEAVFLLGLERNGDVVEMSSSAPLLGNVNDQQWPVALINFDSARAVGRSSYEVQKLLAGNRPDAVLPTRLEPEPELGQEELFALAGSDEKNGDLLLRVVNRANAPRTAEIKLKSFAAVGSSAQVTVLGNNDPGAENTLDDPAVVVPVTTEIPLPGPDFVQTFAPNSLTLLRIPVGGKSTLPN